MIVLLGGEKGGTGKSTMATNLAVAHLINGKDVILVDADKQASSADWAALRDENEITPRVPCIQKLGKKLHVEIQDLEKRYGTVIVDCGGRDSIEMRSAMLVADRFFSPLKPSQFDAWTLENLSPVVEQAQLINPNLKVDIFINQASPNPRIREVHEIQGYIQDFPELNLAKAIIKDRIAFRKAASAGKTVLEFSDEKAIRELIQLYKEIFDNGDQKKAN